MLTLMRRRDLEIWSVQEPHFSSAEDTLDALRCERNYHRVRGTITADRGGMTRILSKQCRVTRYEQLPPRILIAEVMDKSDHRLAVLAAHFSDQAKERQW